MMKSLFKSLRNNTLLGIMLMTPIIATVLIFDFLFNLATAWLPATAFPKLNAIWGGYALKLLTLAAVLVALFLFGLMTRNFFGRNLYIFGDRLMTRIPLVKRIYNAVQKISVALFAQRRTLFKEVVLVEYPRKGVYSLAFVTSELGPELSGPITAERQPGEPCVNLFVATSPNPTSGLMIMVPRSQVHTLNLSITDAMTFIMSAGTVQPHDPNLPQRSLLERLEAGLADPAPPRKTAPVVSPQSVMTRIHRTEALCLRISPSGQTSRVVTWLSAEFGCLKTLIKGSCRPKSAFLGQFDLYYSCELLFYARNADRLNIARECAPLRLREALRSNWRAGAAASYLCDLTSRVCPPDLEAAVAHQSLNAALDGLAAGENPLGLLLWFECRLLAIQGLAPQLAPCPLCRGNAPETDGTQRFSLGAGRLVCHHKPLNGGPEDTVALSDAVSSMLHEWQTRLAPPGGDRMPTADTLLGLRRFLGLFIMYHIEPLAAPRRIALTLLNTCS